VSAPQLHVDASGNAVATWVQSNGTSNSTYANRFVNGAWQGAELIETGTGAVRTPIAHINAGGNVVVAWGQTDGTRYNLWGNTYLSGQGWQGAQLLETVNVDAVTQPTLAWNGDTATVLWRQSDGTAQSIYRATYSLASQTWSAASLFETLNTAAYTAEILRGAIQAVPHGENFRQHPDRKWPRRLARIARKRRRRAANSLVRLYSSW